MMSRLNAVLLLGVLVCAFLVVHFQHQSRRLFVEVERAQAKAEKLDAQREALELDRRSQSTALRVEKIAKERLQMHTPNVGSVLYVPLPSLPVQQGAKP